MPESVRHPARLVSLVPSLTETVFALGAGSRLVGRTRWCVKPEAALRVPMVGGTKDPDLARIQELVPDLILANREENRREDVRALERVAPVLVTYPRSPGEVAGMLLELGQRLGTEPRAAELARAIRDELASARAETLPLRVVYLVWRDPWMTVTDDTYIGRMLAESGFDNAFAALPGRYPEVSTAAIVAAGAEVVLLPDEPFAFADRHRQELAAAGVGGAIELVAGADFSWFGARTAEALAHLRGLRSWVAGRRAGGVGPA